MSALFCGAANTARQTLYRRYMAGWFEYHLRGDASYGPWVFNQTTSPLAADLASNKITYAEAPAALAAWRYVNFGINATNAAIAGNEANPDGDRCPNLEEYAFNTDPLVANASPVVSAAIVETGGGQFLAMAFPLVTAASDITCRVEASADLQTWLPGCTYSGTNRVTATAHTTEFSRVGTGLENIVVRDNSPVVTAAQRFLRLRVTQP